MSTAPLAQPLRERSHGLFTRMVILAVTTLVGTLVMISGTLWLSWQLEGAASAINDAGSLRMRANRVEIDLSLAREGRDHQLPAQLARMEQTIERLRAGNAARPRLLPNQPEIRAQLDRISTAWYEHLKPSALADAAEGASASSYVELLPGFVEAADGLVLMIERNNAEKTRLLRASQLGLAVVASIGAVTLICLLYFWIARPVKRLDNGLQRMAAREFSLRLPVDRRDEFGTLAEGFNLMASELQALYSDLASRVDKQTAELARRNRELEALYDMTAFLNRPADSESICHGFVQRVMAQFDADGGSVRMLDSHQGKLHLLAADGLSDDLIEAERCQDVGECFSGKAAGGQSVVIADLRHQLPTSQGCYRCIGEGFSSIAVIPIEIQNGVLGSFSLHFREAKLLTSADRQLLETLGHHLGVALDHLRLSATARQLAIVEERTLVAQGLHDSIAQALNFLNLEVQLLGDAVARENLTEVRAIVPQLRRGVEESYQDVRELLHNFRAKLDHGNLRDAVEATIARFQGQCSTKAHLAIRDSRDARALDPEQQLQVLFILQEALSNVRKHAQAENVTITVQLGRDFRLVVEDDGRGFDPDVVAAKSDGQFGLHVMRERAQRISGKLAITSQPGDGVRVELALPRPVEARPSRTLKRGLQ